MNRSCDSFFVSLFSFTCLWLDIKRLPLLISDPGTYGVDKTIVLLGGHRRHILGLVLKKTTGFAFCQYLHQLMPTIVPKTASHDKCELGWVGINNLQVCKLELWFCISTVLMSHSNFILPGLAANLNSLNTWIMNLVFSYSRQWNCCHLEHHTYAF